MEPLTTAEQRELDQRVNKLQIRQFINFFGSVAENCFASCVEDFTSKTLSSRESSCITRCVGKTISTNQRLRDRFDEHQNSIMEQLQREHAAGTTRP